jgi:hypothetical protein
VMVVGPSSSPSRTCAMFIHVSRGNSPLAGGH